MHNTLTRGQKEKNSEECNSYVVQALNKNYDEHFKNYGISKHQLI